MKQNGFRSKLKGLKSVGIRVGASTLYHSGAVNLLQAKARRKLAEKPFDTRRGFPFGVLLYHRVNSDGDPYFPSVSTEVFDAQMGYLARNYRVLSLGEIISRIQQGLEVEPYTIAVTFDDGYRDNFTHAHPILKKYRLPATLFVATSYIGTNRAMWNDQVSWAFKHTGRREFTLGIANRQFAFSLRSTQDRINSLDIFLEALKSLSDSEKNDIVDFVMRELIGEKVNPQRLMLNWSELRQLAEEGWELGSHTVSHVILTRVGAAGVNHELRESKKTLEKELERQIFLFAYPNGKQPDFDLSTKDLVRDAGYKAAVTTVDGLNRRETDVFEIRRHSSWEAHLPSFAVKTVWKYWKETQLKRRIES